MNYRGLKCWYCGGEPSTRDHVCARKSRLGKKAKNRARKMAMEQFGRNTVPACAECNSLKSGHPGIEEFRLEILSYADVRMYIKPREFRLHRLANRLKPWNMKFYGERGAVDAEFPAEGQAQPFRYKWKMRSPRNEGDQAVRIEECAKRGKYREVLAGLINGR